MEFFDTTEAEEMLLTRRSEAFKEITEAIAQVIVRYAHVSDPALGN